MAIRRTTEDYIPVEELQAVVLMGGMGTRLRAALPESPKSLADVFGKPFFERQLELMKWQGLKRFVFCVGHMGEDIERYFEDGKAFGVNIVYSYDGPRPLGTAGALGKAAGLLDDRFFVMYGDSYMDVDLLELDSAYRSASRSGAKALMAVFRNEGQYDTSNVLFDRGLLAGYDKKNPWPDMRYIDYGMAVLSKEVVEALPRMREVDLSDVYTELVNEGAMAGYEVSERFYEIGRPESLEEFREFFAGRLQPRPAIFLDRDGTINGQVYNKEERLLDSPMKPEQLELLPGAAVGLAQLRSLGYLLIVVTNQPAAAKGKTGLLDLYAINRRLRELLEAEGAGVDDILMCPHHPEGMPGRGERGLVGPCDCRKPGTGLIERAALKHNIDLADSYMLGDSIVDVEAGRDMGLTTVFMGEKENLDRGRAKGIVPDRLTAGVMEFAAELDVIEGVR